MNKQDANRRKYATTFAEVGSLMIILFFIFVNYTTSSSFPWFIFPSFAVLWWPLSIILAHKKTIKAFSMIGTIIIIAFFCITNYFTSPAYPWFIYPVFAVLWWPLSLYFGHRHSIKRYSVLGAFILIAFLVINNYLFTPGYPWVLYAVCPILMWPVCIFLGRRGAELPIALLCSFAIIAYYVALNILISNAFPWAIFPAYAILWWPLAVFFAKHRRFMSFSFLGFTLTLVFFITVNRITTPHQIWWIYPVFSMVWWPLSTYYFDYKKKLYGEQ